MRAYAEEGLNIVEVSKEPKNKLYAFSEGKLLALILFVCFISFFLIDYLHEIIIHFLFGFVICGMIFYFAYVRIGNMLEAKM